MLNRLSRSAIAKAYLTSILGVISGLLTQLIFIKALTSYLSSNEFSLYGFVFQVCGYLAMFQLGLDYATSREISLNIGKGSLSQANYSYWFIRKFNFYLLWLVLAGILIFVAIAKEGWIFSAFNDNATAAYLILLFGISQALQFYLTPNIAALIGSNKQYITNVNNASFNILSTILGFILLKKGMGIYSLPIALIFFGIVNRFVLTYLVKNNCEWLDSKPTFNDKTFEKKTINYAINATIGGLAWTIEATSDVILLNSVGLFEFVGIYIIWWRFPQMLFDLVTRFVTSSTPSFSTTFGRSFSENKKLFQKVFLLVGGGAIIVGVGISLWLPSLIEVWIGKNEYRLQNPYLYGSLIGGLIFLRIIGNCFGMYLVAIGKVKITSRLAWIQAVVKILLALLLTRYFSLAGIFAASVIASLLQVLWLGFYLVQRQPVLSIKSSIWLICISMTGITFLLFSYNNFNIEHTWIPFLLKVSITAILTCVVWLSSIFLFGFNDDLGLKKLRKYVFSS